MDLWCGPNTQKAPQKIFHPSLYYYTFNVKWSSETGVIQETETTGFTQLHFISLLNLNFVPYLEKRAFISLFKHPIKSFRCQMYFLSHVIITYCSLLLNLAAQGIYSSVTVLENILRARCCLNFTVRPLLCKTVAPCIRQTKPYVAQKIMSHTGHVVQEIAQKPFLLFLNRPCKWWTPLILFRQQLFRKQKPQVLKSWSLTFCSLYQKEDPHSSVWTFEVLVKPFSFMPSKLNMLFSLDKLHKVHSNHDSRQILILICDTLITFSTVWHLCVPDAVQM